MKRWLILGLACTTVAWFGFSVFLKRSSLNDWEIRNLPVGDGPVVCFGDSLVAGTGADRADGTYPAHLQRCIGRKVIALGTPGRTSEAGLQELRQHQEIQAPLVVVTLGGNDILRRIPLADTIRALRGIILECQDRGAVVVFTAVEGLVGGERRDAYRSLCEETGAILVEDVLDGILSDQALVSDQIHPNSRGYAIMAGRVAETIAAFLH